MAKFTPTDNYGVIPNSILNDDSLSYKAKGLFAQIQSKPPGWTFSVERLAKQSADGKASVAAGLKELENAGYLQRIRFSNNKGFVEYEYILSSKRKNEDFENQPFSENPKTENPMLENPMLENRRTKKERDISNKDISNKELINITDAENQQILENIQIQTQGNQINEIITLFKKSINPTINYQNMTYRNSTEILIKQFGFEKTSELARFAISVQNQKYAPSISNPYDLKEKYPQLLKFHNNSKQLKIKRESK